MCDLDLINGLYPYTKEQQVEITKLFFTYDIDLDPDRQTTPKTLPTRIRGW